MSDGFAALALDPAAQAVFARICWAAGERSNLLQHDVTAVAAVLNLARFHAWHRAPVETWRGGHGHVKLLVHSLAQHLLGRHPVPRVLGSAWFGDDSQARDAERWWFVEHAGGCPFRQVTGMPVKLTRKMERLFLQSPADLPLRAAIRRAELLGLGAEPSLVEAILQTDLAKDLDHGEFWRSVFHWLIGRWETLVPAQVGPIVAYLFAVRIRERVVMTASGEQTSPPRDPGFTLAGRSPESLWRQVLAWRREVQLELRPGRTWAAAGWGGMRFCPRELESSAQWQIEELLSSVALRAEGRALRHCVATYVWRCVRGVSSIWTLRCASPEGPFASRFTIEVEPRSRRIVQIRGFGNCRALGLPRELIARWARQEQLHMLAS